MSRAKIDIDEEHYLVVEGTRVYIYRKDASGCTDHLLHAFTPQSLVAAAIEAQYQKLKEMRKRIRTRKLRKAFRACFGPRKEKK